MIKIERHQIWAGDNRTEFYIDDVRELDGQVWIFYTNTFTQQTYSCLEGAFRQRFSPVVNRG